MIPLRSLPRQEARVALSSLRFSGPWKLDPAILVSHIQTIDLEQQTTLITQVRLGKHKIQKRNNDSPNKETGMLVLIKGFPWISLSSNKKQGSPGWTVFNTLLQCAIATKQEPSKDKTLRHLVFCFLRRSYHNAGKPCSVSEEPYATSISWWGLFLYTVFFYYA